MPRYPLATLAAYGLDNTFATKLVVAIQRTPRGDVSEMRTWTTVGTDVRRAPVIAEEVRQFLNEQRVKETAATDRVIGCPHEEGIDYPMGRVCPRCPFWAGVDRFTHEPIPPAEATMTPAEVLEDLSQEWTEPPLDALESADAHRDALVEPLLAALDRGIANPADASDEDGMLFSHALYLFAKWRETRAYPYVIRWLSLPGEGPFDIAGDIVTEHGPRILAAVCDGDLEPIKTLVLSREANEYGRSAAIDALGLLAAWLEVPRETVIELFDWLAREGLERERAHVWDSLADACRAIEAHEMLPALRRAFDDDLIDELYISRGDVDAIETMPAGETIREMRERFPPIEDVAEATSWWSSYADPSLVSDGTVPYRAPDKVGRNDPCPCGSGKKYKKCHGA